MKAKIWLVPILVAGVLTVAVLFAWPLWNADSNLITVTGSVQPGVEAGCMILQSNGTQYLLLDWSNYPPPGTQVTITGYLEHNVASYCMQGSGVIHVISLSIAGSATWISSGTATATTISGSTTGSATITGVPFTISGYVYQVVENPQCTPQCGVPSFILTYLYVQPGANCSGAEGCYPAARYYRLLNIDPIALRTTIQNGTYATVTGILGTPSMWNCNSFYVPKVCMSGDIYVQTIS
jgi:hypothetical protein